MDPVSVPRTPSSVGIIRNDSREEMIYLGSHRTSFESEHEDCFMIYIYNAQAISSDANLHALLDSAGRFKFRAIALQEMEIRRKDVRLV